MENTNYFSIEILLILKDGLGFWCLSDFLLVKEVGNKYFEISLVILCSFDSLLDLWLTEFGLGYPVTKFLFIKLIYLLQFDDSLSTNRKFDVVL